MKEFPRPLQEIVDFYEQLTDNEKREALINDAALSGQYRPGDGEAFDLEDLRKDNECSDRVGIFVKVAKNGEVTFKILLGEKVQTLTRAMAVILCRGLNGCSAKEIIELPDSFVARIVGGELHRLRSRTVYYVLRRLKEALRTLG